MNKILSLLLEDKSIEIALLSELEREKTRLKSHLGLPKMFTKTRFIKKERLKLEPESLLWNKSLSNK
jgi:hypothetical protein